MLAKQTRHIRDVMALVYGDTRHTRSIDPKIAASWQRCVHQHGLNPETLREAMILPHHHLVEHQDAMDSLTAVARHGLQALWKQIRDMGYVVLLADAQGVVVESFGCEQQQRELTRAGLHLGALWRENTNGTSAVAMVLATGNAAIVHRADHFDATHIGLSCTAAPVFDSQNRLRAVLDVSALTPPPAKQSQYWVLQLVRHFTALVEIAALIQTHRRDWIVRLGYAAEFLNVAPEFLIAVNDAGQISGANHAFFRWAAEHLAMPSESLIGSPFDRLADKSLLAVYSTAGERTTLTLGNTALFASVSPPADQRTAAAHEPELPAALSQLYGPQSRHRRTLQRIAVLADTQVPVLINGETGSGKEFLARAIHLAGSRAGQPFIAVNCAAIPENLIESELYGYAPGSFSGADRNGKTGLIQAADGGTLFLDEIGDMPLYLQSRLLRVLSEREVMPVGSTRAVKVDVRIISATHADLQARIGAGKFREDLYYRLNGMQLTLPPVRERDDFDYIMRIILQRAAEKTGCPLKALSARALDTLRAYHWPGNLRQLASVLEVALLTAAGVRIESDDLPDYIKTGARPFFHDPADTPAAVPDKSALAGADTLTAALDNYRGNVSALAKALGVSRMTVYRYLKKYGLAV
ncbi:sigma-54-dependent Fis family transcriptional regulator [Uruburuella testudinis]|uniref:Sigma-54-dependent Fis family transcriptional regulator n=1 Tax=Uruburuella testudinis TaxID=1282863 RepID=A0ABY4DSN3_9NEIS|nr:sigma-54-dependent Fis family transcriptional regulator [Uruburuella testudinis]UOO82052.1 sigma-54-dependent Fis family transcriptional regulator [Uruburuella testudinis]